MPVEAVTLGGATSWRCEYCWAICSLKTMALACEESHTPAELMPDNLAILTFSSTLLRTMEATE